MDHQPVRPDREGEGFALGRTVSGGNTRYPTLPLPLPRALGYLLIVVKVCGIERVSLHHETSTVYVIPIAGDIDGRHTDEQLKRLKTSDAATGKEGLRVTLNGGLYDKVKQQAVVEFICDSDRTGLEGEEETKKSEEEKKKEKSLKFVSYDTDDKELHVLRLEWKTKYACEGVGGEDPPSPPPPPPDQGSSWGFFTWFIIMYVGFDLPPFLHPSCLGRRC